MRMIKRASTALHFARSAETINGLISISSRQSKSLTNCETRSKGIFDNVEIDRRRPAKTGQQRVGLSDLIIRRTFWGVNGLIRKATSFMTST